MGGVPNKMKQVRVAFFIPVIQESLLYDSVYIIEKLFRT